MLFLSALGFTILIVAMILDPNDKLRLLVERAQHGEPAAIEPLLEARREDIRKFVFNFLSKNNWNDVDDIVQDTFIHAYNNTSKLRDPSKFYSWVYGIAKYKSLNHVGKKRSSMTISIYDLLGFNEDSRSEDTLSILKDDKVDVEKLIVNRMTAKEVNDILQNLPEEFREVSVLRFIYQLKYDEIAEVTGDKINTVKTRILRGRALIIKQMTSKGLIT